MIQILMYIQTMPSLQRVKVKGHTYWRIVESRRINGKPHAIPILHLGTANQLLQRLLSSPQGRLKLRSYQHGEVAVLRAMADRLGLVSIIDHHVPTSWRALSVGTTLLLAAINRAVEPRSKRGWAAWAKGTSVHRLFDISPDKLTSQYFWDQMDRVSEKALSAIEDDLSRKVVQEFAVKLDTLFYDTTNFFTYIASDNECSKLARRGRSKQRRSDLRQFSLALLVSRDGQIPLCSRLYQGNTVDSKAFPDSLTLIRRRMEKAIGKIEKITLVYDKGNNSKQNQALVDDSPLHYVAALSPHQHKELLGIPAKDYTPLGPGLLQGLSIYRCRRKLWEAERTIVMFISPKLRAGQVRGLKQQLNKRLRALSEWKETLSKPNSGPRTTKGAQKRIDSLLEGQYLRHILRIEYNSRRKGANRLRWWVDSQALEYLHTEMFGKRILMTDCHDWETLEIILAYNGQSKAEHAFKQLKDVDHLAVRPQHHWTDQKVRVHTFICLVALLLCRLIEREARLQVGYRGSINSLLDLLGTIRLAMVLHPSSKMGGRPKCQWVMEEADKDTLRIFRHLVPAKTPFVYTPC